MSNVDTEFKQKNRCQCLTRTEEKSMRKRIAMVLLGWPGSRHTGRNKYSPTVSAQTVQAAGKTGWTQESGTWYFYKDGVKQTGWQTWDGKKYYLNADMEP